MWLHSGDIPKGVEVEQKSENDCYAELLSAVINQAVLDALAPPRKSNSKQRHAIQSQKERQDAEKGCMDFIESDYLEAFFELIKMLGRASSNAKVIRRLVRKYRAEGKYVVIQGMVTNEGEWRDMQKAIFSKWGNSRNGRLGARAQESDREEERLVPLD